MFLSSLSFSLCLLMIRSYSMCYWFAFFRKLVYSSVSSIRFMLTIL